MASNGAFIMTEDTNIPYAGKHHTAAARKNIYIVDEPTYTL
jgi:hypothetical protein